MYVFDYNLDYTMKIIVTYEFTMSYVLIMT